MNNKAEIIKELSRAMEFYRELGFEYLPVKREAIADSLSEAAHCAENISAGPNKPAEKVAGAPAQNREDPLARLREEIGDCRRCGLSEGRKNIVFGEGPANADLMFIGEGPGREEDVQARPFVGDAGQLLTNLIVKLGLKRQEVYIANIVKCRPPNNRNPQPDEIAACRPFIEKQIEIIGPKAIVCLGRVSANALLAVDTPITRLRGVFARYQDIPVMPTFHPAYLLRNPKDKWLTWDDMQKVMKLLK